MSADATDATDAVRAARAASEADAGAARPADTAAAVPESPVAPLRRPVFRMLWLAWLAANVTMWMNDVAAAWLMTSLTDSIVMVALVQAASTLPVFVLGLPSGALADIVDRRRYFALTQLWVAVVAVVLGAFSLAGALSAPWLLALTFANGIGMAMRWPVFAAIVPELVPRAELPSALALNGIAMNMSRVIGPIVAGALLASVGEPWVFLLNAVLAVVAFTLILRWRAQRKPSALPGERFVGAMRVGLQHVVQSPPMRVVLIRIFLFFLQSTALTALLPLVARRLGGGAGTFTLLLAAMGCGAILGALFVLPRLRQRFSGDRMVQGGTVVHGLATIVVALSPTPWLSVPAMALAGLVWLAVANTLTVSAQMALPNWVRARGMSIYQMALMGGSASGAAVWGWVASHSSVPASLIAAALAGPAVLLLTRRLQVSGRAAEDLSQVGAVSSAAPPVIPIDPDEGPVMVTVEYQIDPARAAEFAAVMRETRRARLRQGALSWGLFRDTARVGRYIEYFVDESWVEHQRRLERFTAADIGLRERRLAFHLGSEPPRAQRYVADDID
ncbi:MFS transporter [Piscinibacter sakaiensis]|uniref:MFS transporter n=1 Tax=Piscinibacter sakaiensis TaxID=1547922 RepID=A0A0K8NUF2_PISS1|nr:MFS transporter [Piscinibacter sakaiensis]